MKTDVYQIVTDRIIEKLESGVIPWRRSWSTKFQFPRNLISGKPYNGANVILLWSMQYQSPHWLTFRQAQALGGTVKKGEKSTPIVFWNFLEKTNPETGKKFGIPILKYFSGFNLSQCEGIPEEKIPEDTTADRPAFSPIESAQAIIDAMPKRPPIETGSNIAAYSPTLDAVRMPCPESFDSPEEYYSVLFHELAHSTGHASRLNRPGVASRDQQDKKQSGREELVAELSASFLNAICGIEQKTEENSAAYLEGWLKILRSDPKALVIAAGAAQKAASFIQGIGTNSIEEVAEEHALA